MNKNVFIYWTGKKYILIEILRDLIFLHSNNGKNYKVHFITDENYKEFIDLPDNFLKLTPTKKSDILRVNLLYKYGGIWLDSDTIVMDNLSSLFKILETKEGFILRESKKSLVMGVLGSNKGSDFLKEMINQQNKILKGKITGMKWSALATNSINSVLENNPKILDNYDIIQGKENIYPCNYMKTIQNYIDSEYNNYKNLIRDFQPLVVLVNRVYKRIEKDFKTKEDFLSSSLPLNYFINKSIRNFTNL